MSNTLNPVITIEPDHGGKYAWFCDVCGWAGLHCDTHSFAAAEANRHLAREHPFLAASSGETT